MNWSFKEYEMSMGLQKIYYDCLVLKMYPNQWFFRRLYSAALNKERLQELLPGILPSHSAFWVENNQTIIRSITRMGIDVRI